MEDGVKKGDEQGHKRSATTSFTDFVFRLKPHGPKMQKVRADEPPDEPFGASDEEVQSNASSVVDDLDIQEKMSEISEGCERWRTFEEALGNLRWEQEALERAIKDQHRRIKTAQGCIRSSREKLGCMMQAEWDQVKISLDRLPSMKVHEANLWENQEKMVDNQKKNRLQTQRFNNYRKQINIETRLLELEKKIAIAWKRDEISAGIRDWGFLSILILGLLAVSFTAWHSL
ncbi:hypothetical protein BY458DRAFT_519962 [Sporodiniella umbellata]|nr:hypothetical protein BY458DRAFT_519962 [Sporodiniella umbellata]